jgi:hypothetical protein
MHLDRDSVGKLFRIVARVAVVMSWALVALSFGVHSRSFAKETFALFKVVAVIAPVVVLAGIGLQNGKYRAGWLAFDLIAVTLMFGFWFVVAAATF